MKVGFLVLIAMFPVAAQPESTPFAGLTAEVRELGPGRPEFESEAAFERWKAAEDAAVRARLAEGELDSMVHLLLFGTSFTKQARMTVANLGEEVRAGLLRARLADFVAALEQPGANERVALVASLLREQGRGARDPETGVFILQHVQRVLRDRIQFAERSAQAAAQGTFAGDANLFADRGVSLDTTILPNYGVDRALEQMRALGLIEAGRVARAAVIGPGLDFIDKDSGFDYYPQQTLQPFALADSLARWELGSAARITIFDISRRVLEHVQDAAKRPAYTIQLPLGSERQWSQGAAGYWARFGSGVGEEVPALPLPDGVKGVRSRAVRVPVPPMEAVELNIVTARDVRPEAERFDVMVATNILVYYDRAEQALAMTNIAAMLKPGGWLITNDPLPEVGSVGLRLVGKLEVGYAEQPRMGDTMYWWRRE